MMSPSACARRDSLEDPTAVWILTNVQLVNGRALKAPSVVTNREDFRASVPMDSKAMLSKADVARGPPLLPDVRQRIPVRLVKFAFQTANHPVAAAVEAFASVHAVGFVTPPPPSAVMSMSVSNRQPPNQPADSEPFVRICPAVTTVPAPQDTKEILSKVATSATASNAVANRLTKWSEVLASLLIAPVDAPPAPEELNASP